MQSVIQKSFASWLGHKEEEGPITDGEFDAKVTIKGNLMSFDFPGGRYGITLTPEQLKGIEQWQWMWKGPGSGKPKKSPSQTANP